MLGGFFALALAGIFAGVDGLLDLPSLPFLCAVEAADNFAGRIGRGRDKTGRGYGGGAFSELPKVFRGMIPRNP